MKKLDLNNERDIKKYIDANIPARIDKYVKATKGIHNLLNKIIIVSDDNFDYLKNDIPDANMNIYKLCKYISMENFNCELIAAKLDKKLSPVLTFEIDLTNEESASYCDEDLECLYYVDLYLQKDQWKVKHHA